jgi:type II secretion system protein N
LGGRFDLFFQVSAARLWRVKKLSKAILLAVGALFVLVAFGFFCINLYIQSPRTQEQIQEQLSRSLRIPLKITNTSISPWGGLKVSGITVPQGDMNFLEAGSFAANYRAFPLLGGRLVIPELTLDQPKIVWQQNAEGRWKMPKTAKVAAEEPKSPEAAPPAGEPEKKEKSKSGFTVVVERFLVKNGSVDLIDKEGVHTAVLTGVHLTYTTLTEELAEGTAVIERAVWAETLALENVRTPFKYTEADFTLPDITATLGGGPVRGKFHGQPEAPKSPFETTLTFDQVNLDRVATEAGWKEGQISGTAAGKLDLHGDMHRAERAEGTGQVLLRDGRFQQLELFQTVGQVLNIRELSDLRIKEGTGDFRVAGEKVLFDRLTLSAANLQIDAKGQIRFDKKVNLEAQLGVDEALLKQLPDIVRGSFTTAEGNPPTIAFNVTGSTDKLRTNLMDKLIGQKIGQQFDDLLTGLFGGTKKEDDKKKKEEEEKKKAEKAEKDKKKKEAAAAKAKAQTPAPAAGTPVPTAPPAPAAVAPPPGPTAAPTTAITPAKP